MIRAFAFAMALDLVAPSKAAIAAPADIFDIAAPVVGAEPPKAASIKAGDAAVSTQTGALTYGYPITVPPGRHGMAPSLSLAYSSQAPIYGGIAAGWSLSMPSISVDTSTGRLWRQGSTTKQYTSSLAGERPLIQVDEPRGADATTAWRAQNDATFTRYELTDHTGGFVWRALSLDGTKYFFGDDDHVGTCRPMITDEYAPLTRHVDGFGNSVEYFYAMGVDRECRIDHITWGQNSNAGIAAFAKVQFNYAASPLLCADIPVGSQTSYRTGEKIVTGASRLDSIVATAFPPGGEAGPADHTRVISLTYSSADAGCTSSSTHAAFRSLASIQESAWVTNSPHVDLPAVKFAYGDVVTNYPQPVITNAAPWQDNGAGHSLNLAWGYRFTDERWPSVEGMMLDIDGDGRLDRVSNAPVVDGDHTLRCRAQWERNVGLGPQFGEPRFADPQYIDLPMLKWGQLDPNVNTSVAYDGGAWANANSLYKLEGCALNYQRTAFKNSEGANVGWFKCPPPDDPNVEPPSGVCSNGSDRPPHGVGQYTVLAFRWMDIDNDGLVDLVASPSGAGPLRYDLQWGRGINAWYPPQEPPLFGDFPPCPVTSYSDGTPGNYTMCGGMYPWFVYRNHGNGVFGRPGSFQAPFPDDILYEPVALEGSSADSSLTGSPSGQLAGILDIDGDGYQDAVAAGGSTWSVFRNDGTGQFLPASTTGPFTWSASTADKLSQTTCVTYGDCSPIEVEGLIDLNGDGLDDHWESEAPSAIEFNGGAGFLTDYTFTTVRPGTEGTATATNTIPDPRDTTRNFVEAGYRVDTSRVYDLDGDGRADVLHPPQTQAISISSVFYNQGGQFGESTTSIGGGGSDHTIAVSKLLNAGATIYTWEVRSDLVDLDGDGVAESIDFGHGPTANQFAVARMQTAQPRRLLISIDNQRGATTQIAYAATSDFSVVEQDPSTGRTMPHSQWVVKNVTVVDNLPSSAATSGTTTYHYKNPVFNAEMDRVPDGAIAVSESHQGRRAFRGFEEVTATGPSGSTTVEQYRYDVDWSGRLATTLVVAAESPNEVKAIDETTWERHNLFCSVLGGCQIRTYHAAIIDHWTCINGQTESACRRPDGGAAHVRTKNTVLPVASTTTPNGPTLAFETTSSRLQDFSDADGDRITDVEYELAANDVNYHLLVKSTTSSEVRNGTPVPFAKSNHTFDGNFLVEQSSGVWFDDPAVSAQPTSVTHFGYDMTTGNLTQRWKPVQYAGNGHSASYSYDSRKLFVATETQEPAGQPSQNMVLDYTWEYGTGTKLVTLGPNIPSCANTVPDTCNGTPLKEQHKIRVDGLGRTIERWGAWGTDSTTYPQYLLETFAYDDNAWVNSHVATNVVHRVGLSSNAGVITYAQDKLEVDGHGRPLEKTIYAAGSAPVDAVTIFSYRNDGTLASVNVPDPTLNNASTVTFTYGFDSLGRATSMRRPDGGQDPSGVDVSYDGLTTTTKEHVGSAGGKPASTITIKDRFGRLIEVREQTSDDPNTPHWTSTTYQYDAANNVTSVTDPEGVSTTMQHDAAGHRTAITRGTRTWKYGYDKNGNLISEIVPGYAADQHDILDYATTTAYDDLDRPISKVLGHRKLSSADVTLFGADHETYTWDYYLNRKGHLYSWAAYGAGASGTNYALQYQLGWDAVGVPYATTEWFNSAGYSNIQRQFVSERFMNGLPRLNRYYDNANMTFATFALDGRGLPTSVRVTASGGLDQYVAQQTRNVAGVVTKSRSNNTGGGPMTFIESNWTYDRLGRVTSQIVQKGPGPVQVAREDLAYFGNDDPKSLDQYLGADQKHFDYTYDSRHQLKSAIEASTPGYFSASYSFGEAGRLATAVEASALGGAVPPNSTVKPRDVTYVYVDGLSPGNPYGDLTQHPLDLEAPLMLRRNSDGQPFASYDYDAAGNQTLRCLGTITSVATQSCSGESWRFAYDGKDQLRRASHFSSTGVLLDSDEYWYDPDGRRTETVARDGSNTKTGLTYWVGDVEAHYDGNGVVQGIDSYITMGMPVAKVDRVNNKFEFLFHGLGNNTIAAVERSTGLVNTSVRYAPFGEIIEATDAGAPLGQGLAAHPRRFNDKYYDAPTELTYYGARYYDNLALNWTQTDPLYRVAPDISKSEPRRQHLYTFSSQNPLRYLDPDGRADVSVTHEDGKQVAGHTDGTNTVEQTDKDFETPAQPAQKLDPPPLGTAEKLAIVALLAVNPELRAVSIVLSSGFFSGPSEGDALMAATCSGAACSSESSLARGASADGEAAAVTNEFRPPSITTNARGQLTNGTYTIDEVGMAAHKTGKTTGGKSQFLFSVDAEKATLDAAAYADHAGLWDVSKAKVPVINGPVGVQGSTGVLTNWINVYRTKTGFVHGAPGSAP
jgi:RHS repeat-associated protein